MFFKKTVHDFSVTINDCDQGNGFYLIKIKQDDRTDMYYRKDDVFMFIFDIKDAMPEFLELFENKEEAPEKPQKHFISESFVLKAMAIAKANTNTIKISDILKD